MTGSTWRLFLPVLGALALAGAARPDRAATDRATVTGDRVLNLTRESPWTLVTAIPIAFPTYHPQGMVKIGETLFVSAVEVTVPTRRTAASSEGYDRDAGEGVGHLFKLGMDGRLIADLRLGEGTMYHPGGLDYDGRSIWVPVAEYRPNSRSIVYRVDPETMRATESFRFPDHIGAVIHDTDDGSIHGVSWGSRRFYRWTTKKDVVTNAALPPEKLRTLNPSYYVDYQDCKYAGRHRMLCTGVTELRQSAGTPSFRLGGLELIDLAAGRPLHQVPVLLWTANGLDMTHNPVWLEPRAAGLRGYFMPDDERSTLYVYDAQVR